MTGTGEEPPLTTHVAIRSRRGNPVFTPEYRAMVSVLVEARKAAGLSQRQLAARLGRAASHVGLIEAGQRRIDALELLRISRFLGADPVRLYGAMARSVNALQHDHADARP
jgi:transcriptional regulator with XRE-family HTH domain